MGYIKRKLRLSAVCLLQRTRTILKWWSALLKEPPNNENRILSYWVSHSEMSTIYNWPFFTIKNTKLVKFQFKINHGIVYTKDRQEGQPHIRWFVSSLWKRKPCDQAYVFTMFPRNYFPARLTKILTCPTQHFFTVDLINLVYINRC